MPPGPYSSPIRRPQTFRNAFIGCQCLDIIVTGTTSETCFGSSSLAGSFDMSSAELALDLEQSSESLFQRLLDQFRFAEAAKEWSRWRQALTSWEDEHLLVDNP